MAMQFHYLDNRDARIDEYARDEVFGRDFAGPITVELTAVKTAGMQKRPPLRFSVTKLKRSTPIEQYQIVRGSTAEVCLADGLGGPKVKSREDVSIINNPWSKD